MEQTKLTVMVPSDAVDALDTAVKAIGLRRDQYLTALIDMRVQSWTKEDLRGSAENIRCWRTILTKGLNKTLTRFRINISPEALERLNSFCKERQIYRDGFVTAVIWEAAERATEAASALYDSGWGETVDWTKVNNAISTCAMDSETAASIEQTLTQFAEQTVQERLAPLRNKQMKVHSK